MRHTKLLVTLFLLSAALTGCSTIEPTLPLAPHAAYSFVDPAKVDAAAYAKDYKSCAELANQNHIDATRAVAGALGAVSDKASFGIIGSSKSRDADRTSVLKRCLSGRGYNIIR